MTAGDSGRLQHPSQPPGGSAGSRRTATKGISETCYQWGLTLEVATAEAAIDGRAWIDPEVVGLAGISDQELARYRRPEACAAILIH